MRTEKEVREQLERLRSHRRTEGTYTDKKKIAWHAAKQALEWILEEENHLLTY